MALRKARKDAVTKPGGDEVQVVPEVQDQTDRDEEVGIISEQRVEKGKGKAVPPDDDDE